MRARHNGVPRNTRWSWTALVAEYGEEEAFLRLPDMPGLGAYDEPAQQNPGMGAETVRKRNPRVGTLQAIHPAIVRRSYHATHLPRITSPLDMTPSDTT